MALVDDVGVANRQNVIFYIYCMCIIGAVFSNKCSTYLGEDPCQTFLPCDLDARIAYPPSCVHYKICVAPYQWLVTDMECGGNKGFYNNLTCYCSTDITCSTWECPPPQGTESPIPASEPCFVQPRDVVCTEGKTVPDRWYCTTYFRCTDGTWTREECPADEPFYDVSAANTANPCSNNIARCRSIPFEECQTITTERPDKTTTTAMPTTTSTCITIETTDKLPSTVVHTTKGNQDTTTIATTTTTENSRTSEGPTSTTTVAPSTMTTPPNTITTAGSTTTTSQSSPAPTRPRTTVTTASSATTLSTKAVLTSELPTTPSTTPHLTTTVGTTSTTTMTTPVATTHTITTEPMTTQTTRSTRSSTTTTSTTTTTTMSTTTSMYQCPPVASACFPPVPCTTNQRVSQPEDCNAFQQCIAPYEWLTVEDECGGLQGPFNNQTCSCDQNGDCSEWECPTRGTLEPPPDIGLGPCFTYPRECGTGFQTVPDMGYCTKYWECSDYRWVPRDCPPDALFYDMQIPFVNPPCRTLVGLCSSIPFDECLVPTTQAQSKSVTASYNDRHGLSKVVFRVTQRSTFSRPAANFIIPFDNIEENIGNGFHIDTSTFVAPVAGDYLFTWLLNGIDPPAYLVVNGGGPAFDSITDSTGSHRVRVNLQLGDQVWLQLEEIPGANVLELTCSSDACRFSGSLQP